MLRWLKEKLNEWLFGEEPPFRYTPRTTEIARSPEGKRLWRIDRKLPLGIRPTVAFSERRVLRCYRIGDDGDQCGMVLHVTADGVKFCYDHGPARPTE